jgi:hypothetical protein
MPRRQRTIPDYQTAIEGRPEKQRGQMRRPGEADRAAEGTPHVPEGGRSARRESRKPRTGRAP